MTNYVSFSLWGNNELYTEGAVQNANQLSDLYLNWKGVFYYDNTVPKDIIERISNTGSLVIDMTGVPFGPFWRFFASDFEDCKCGK